MNYAKQRIRCDIVCTGALVTTPAHEDHPDPDGRARRISEKVPLRRLGRYDEIAPTNAFLASPAANDATGGLFVIDGGLTIA